MSKVTQADAQLVNEDPQSDFDANCAVFEQQILNPPQKDMVQELLEKFKTKSAVIRYLDAQGYSRGAIAKLMGIRYQHVRNVLIQELKR